MAHPTVPSDDVLQYYDMSKEKLVIMFNHYKFPETANDSNEPLQTRTGTRKDVKAIKKDFGKLGYKIVVYHNKDYNTIVKILTEMRNTDYSHLSCLFVIFLTHGYENDYICASDRAYNFNDVTKMFENHPTLDGKPKIFYVQACRGHKMDAGTTIAYDANNGEQKIMVLPSNADFLVMRSSTEGYKSYKGSGMIQDLCSATTQGHRFLDLLEIITIANNRSAIKYPTTTSDEETHEMKRVPETKFTLTKLLRFQPGISSTKVIKYKPDDAFYDMTGERIVVIFNHNKFQSTVDYNYQPPEPRTGTLQDVEAIKQVFGDVDFKIIVYNDMDYNTIEKTLTDMRNTDYSRLSCLCIFILSYGCQRDGICASDRPYNLNEVTKYFENHPTLNGKPKLFFVQADKIDVGSSTAYGAGGDSGDQNTLATPLKADFLVMRSTREDHVSHRDERGSWMIQNLCAVVSEGHEFLDLQQIIAITNKRVAILHSTNTGNKETHGMKQMPETTSTLTKLLMLQTVDNDRQTS